MSAEHAKCREAADVVLMAVGLGDPTHACFNRALGLWFYIRDLSITDLGINWESWNQSLVDTEGRFYKMPCLKLFSGLAL